jgi:hypothetical protein
MNKFVYLALVASASAIKVTPAGNVPANPALTAGAAPGNQPRWGSRYPKIVAPPAPPINWAVPSTKPTRPGPLGSANGDSQSFIAEQFAQVTPAGNVPANPALTAGAAPGNQPRWGSRYPKIVAPPAPPINWAVPSTKPTRPGPLGSANGDSQSFIAEQFAQVTPAGNVPANPALTAGAAPGNQPRWGSRYPKIVAPPAPPINWAVPSTKPTRPGPLGSANGDSQSFIAVTPDHPVFPADQTAGANADGSVPRFGKSYNLKQEPGVQPGDLAATIPPQVTRWANSHSLKQEPGVQPGDLAATIPPQVTRWANSHALKQEPGVQPGDLAATIPPQVTRWANS